MITKIPCINWEFEYILRIISLWPNSYNVPAAVILWLTWITIIPFQFIHMLEIMDDVVELMIAICDFSTEIALFLKLIIAWINRKTLMDLIVEMAEDWEKADVKVTNETRVSCFVTRMDLYIYCGTVIMFFPKLVIVYFTDSPENREFLLKTSYPFDDYKSPAYEMIIFLQLFQGILMISADLMPQALIVALICHTGAQSNILQQQFKEFIANATKNGALSIKSSLQVEKLIVMHQKNINFSDRIEKAFSTISLIHCLCNSITIGCSGLVFVMTRNPLDIGRFSIYLIMKLVQTFFLCYAGEYLRNKSISIANIIYESNWYDLNRKYIKILQLITLRSQKSSHLTAGKFAELSFEMFTVILKTSGSYISMLRATY